MLNFEILIKYLINYVKKIIKNANKRDLFQIYLKQ